MKSVSERLREFAKLSEHADWSDDQRMLCSVHLQKWRDVEAGERLFDLNFDEWRLFILFVAEALEQE